MFPPPSLASGRRFYHWYTEARGGRLARPEHPEVKWQSWYPPFFLLGAWGQAAESQFPAEGIRKAPCVACAWWHDVSAPPSTIPHRASLSLETWGPSHWNQEHHLRTQPDTQAPQNHCCGFALTSWAGMRLKGALPPALRGSEKCQFISYSFVLSVLSHFSHVRLFVTHMDCSLPGSSVHGDSPGKNTGVSCDALLQEIFPTQGLNLCLLH